MSAYDLDALRGLVEDNADLKAEEPLRETGKDEITELAEILTPNELDVFNTHGGTMHRLPLQADDDLKTFEQLKTSDQKNEESGYEPGHYRRKTKGRVIIRDGDSQKSLPTGNEHGNSYLNHPTAASLSVNHNGRLSGVYEHYLLVRPYPSLRILFTSPSMRVPGILQSPLLDRIGGSTRMRDQLVEALAAGQGVTAKVKWLNSSRKKNSRPAQKRPNINHPLEAHLEAGDDGDSVTDAEPAGRARWLHCTPLAGANMKVGVWMIVIVDDDESISRPMGVVAPPIEAPTQHHHRRPSSSMSGLFDAVDESHYADPPAEAGGARTEIRPRRSSETLGIHRSEVVAPLNRESGSTQAIHNQHASSAQRSPRSFFKSGIPASKFFSLDALSRAATGGNAKNRPTSPRSARSSFSSIGRALPRHEPPLPPWPPRSQSKMAPNSGNETKSRVVSMIPEEDHQRRGSELGARDDDQSERSSIRSRGSAFTVRI